MKFAALTLFVALLLGICSAELGYFWHLSDTHMQSDYKIGSDPNKGCYEGEGNAGRFGDYGCRSPYPVEYSGLNEIPTMRPDECPNSDPMFILWTGDSVAMRGGVYSKDVIDFDLRNLTSLLKSLYIKFHGRVPIYPVIGNHDAFPQHQLPGSDYWVYDKVAEYWRTFLPPSAVTTLKKHGYYSVNVAKGLRLIVLNTILFYAKNNMTVNDTDPGNHLEWLHDQLEEAKLSGQSVYIAGHVPVRGDGLAFHNQFEDPFMNVLKDYHRIIQGSFWGHVHIDAFQLYGNCSDNMNCHVAHLVSTMGSDNKRNPSFRRYIVDKSNNYAVDDWRTFYMDLKKANMEDRIRWETLYSAKSAYGITDGSPQSMRSLTDRILTDKDLAQKIWDHWQGGYRTGICDESCRKYIVCTIIGPTHAEYNACMA